MSKKKPKGGIRVTQGMINCLNSSVKHLMVVGGKVSQQKWCDFIKESRVYEGRTNSVADHKPRMLFGKYKDKTLDQIPDSYMEWFWDNIERNSETEHVFIYIEENQLSNPDNVPRQKRPGMIVETKTGFQGRTYHDKGMIMGKIPVYIEGQESPLLCEKGSIKLIGYID